MRFGANLQHSIYEPWSGSYIDYSYLKKLLREQDAGDDAEPWTNDDEANFVEELLNTQLEKVDTFQNETYKSLRDRTNECETKLQHLRSPSKASGQDGDRDIAEAKRVLAELDAITRDISELQKFSRVNYTGFLKAAKKHDRRRGAKYKVRPLLQVRLAALPFNTENYAPLLHEISMMYSFARRLTHLGANDAEARSMSKSGADRYTSHKFWVHPDNLLEVKTYILRRLPVLVYNPQATKNVETVRSDPTITSLYFDSPQFALYDKKLRDANQASSLRLRWYGPLTDKPEMFVEKKTVEQNGDSEEIRMPLKQKYVDSFISGDYKMDKDVEKLREREGNDGTGVATLQHNVEEIQHFIKDCNLQPILRANYKRSAFQIPGDDRVRISLDTDLAFIREDCLSDDRPCRNADDWHRSDIDNLGLKYPFSEIRSGEVSRFPFAVLEIKVRKGASKKTTEWVNELMSSHLVKDAPRFSKFLHGVAELFEDYVNQFPFWLSDLETNILQSPQDAFQEEQNKKAKRAANEQVAGSLPGSQGGAFKSKIGSPVGQSYLEAKEAKTGGTEPHVAEQSGESQTTGEAETDPNHTQGKGKSKIWSLSPFSNSKYARAKRARTAPLPPGVYEPKEWIKDMGPVQVEPKVWLANQRTFIKWQHVSVLLASLSLGLYNAAGEKNAIATVLAVIYTLIAIFTACWGWWTYTVRGQMIRARSGKNFDNIVGPIVICISLFVSLVLNFGLKYHDAVARKTHSADALFVPGEL